MKTKDIINPLIIGGFLLSLFLVPHVLAEDKKDGDKDPELFHEEKIQHLQANKLLAQINLAALAIDLDLASEALKNLEAAEKVAAELEQNAPSFKSSTTLKYGKVSYDVKGESKDYYIPLHEDSFVIRGYEPVFKYFSDPKIEETAAGLVHVEVYLDLRKVKQALTDAKKNLKNKKLGEASLALAKVSEGAIISEQVISSPVWAVHDNLALARSLLKEKNFTAARLALKSSKGELSRLEKDKVVTDKDSAIADLKKDIASLESDLSKQDPTLTERIKHKLSTWMKTVKSWV